MTPITSLIFKIDGTTITLGPVLLNEIELFNRDETRQLTFARMAVLPTDDSWIGKSATVEINGETVFYGFVRDRQELFADDKGVTYAYTARSIEGLMDDIPVTSPFDGTGVVTFNQTTTDPGYDPTYDGMSLGEMILALLHEPETMEFLRAANIGRFNDAGEIDPRTVDDLEAGFLGEYRPAKPVTFSGGQLLQAIRGVLQNAAPNFRVWFEFVWEVPPDRPEDLDQLYALIRFADMRDTDSPMTIDLSSNPQPTVNRLTTDSFTRIRVRGGPDIRPMILDMEDGDIEEFFEMPPWLATNEAAKAAWNAGVWYNSEKKQIKGTCLCRRPRNPDELDPENDDYIEDPEDLQLADPNWLYVDPADNTITWGEDDYNQSSSGLAGFLYIERSPVTDWVETINRRVIFNTALTAGGKAYLQLDDPLPQTDFDKFTLVPGIWPGSLTWRRYGITKLTAEGKSVAKYAQPAFPVPIPFDNADGTPLSFSTGAVAAIYFTPDGGEQRYAMCGLQVDRLNEAIILDQPSVTFFGQPTSLEVGGADVDGQPENIRVLLPVALGPLEVIVPEDDDGDPVYEGTAKTADGIERTHTVDLPDWVSENDTGPVRLWARQLLDSIKDTVVEGQTTVLGYEPVMKPNLPVVFTDPCYPADYFAKKSSVVYSCMLRFNHGNGQVPYQTDFALTNRRDAFRGFDQTLHPIVATPPKSSPVSDVRAGSLISRSAGQVTGGNTRSILEFARTKLDSK